MGGFLSHLTPEHNSEVLEASCGAVRGNIYRHGEKLVDGYLGIPFTKAPIGENRFKKPVAAEKWKQSRDCYKYGPGCPQSGNLAVLIPGELFELAEDNCLTLNVFAPRWSLKEFPDGLPVLVYFHGGGFEVGMSSAFHDYSLSGTLPLKDLVVVTVNYRVGPLGFLTTGDEVAKGNYGLWDQTLALKWVQDHIKSFGGDPQNVTISGTSAGGSSVEWLSLSPHSNKLFHRFIAMSGTGFCLSIIRTKEDESKIFRRFAEFHGYSGTGSESLLQWYQSQPVSKFKEMTGFEKDASGGLHFIPNMDGDFFPASLDQLRKSAPKIDAMVTVGEYEGLDFVIHNPLFVDSMKNFKLFIAEEFKKDVVENPEDIQQEIFDFYTKNKDWTVKETAEKTVIEFLGDSLFNIAALDTVRSLDSHGSNAYMASFNYFNRETLCHNENPPPFRASSHGSEFKYIFGAGPEGNFNPTEEELEMMNLMANFVSNFVKFGNPNGKADGTWKPYSLSSPGSFFKINYPSCEMAENFQNGRLEIFEGINKKSKKYQNIVFGQ